MIKPPPEPVEASAAQPAARICIVYDCRYPASHGGAEKWLRSLGRALVARGARVTYLHGAGRGDERREGVRFVGLAEGAGRYGRGGVRRSLPAVRFAARVAYYLRAHREEFDLVYVHDMPLFPVLAAWWGLRGGGTPWLVEWIEWWSSAYWRSYAGRAVGTLGYLVQRLAWRVTPLAVCYSDRTAAALAGLQPPVAVARLPGQADCSGEAGPLPSDGHLARRTPPLAVFLGRFVPHKRPQLAIDAVERARARVPDLRLILIGSGPEEAALRERAAAGAEGTVEVRTGLSDEEVRDVLGRASVLVHPSAREGFGLAVAEANRRGVPVVLVEGPDNAAPELICRGGGVVVAEPEERQLADAVVQVLQSGETARREALANGERLCRERSVARSSEEVLALAGRLRRER